MNYKSILVSALMSASVAGAAFAQGDGTEQRYPMQPGLTPASDYSMTVTQAEHHYRYDYRSESRLSERQLDRLLPDETHVNAGSFLTNPTGTELKGQSGG